MIMLSRFEMETRHRQMELLKLGEAKRIADEAGQVTVIASGQPRVQSEFFSRRFMAFMQRMKLRSA